MKLGARRGIGGTIASALVFGSLVASNLVLLSGAEEKEKLSRMAELENRVYEDATVLDAVVSFELLSGAQDAAGRAAFPCVMGGSNSLEGFSKTIVLSSAGVAVKGSISSAEGIHGNESYEMLGQYDVTFPGSLGFALTLTSWTVENDSVSYTSAEVRHLGLPGNLSLIEERCHEDLTEVRDLLGTLNPCDTTSVVGALSSAATRIRSADSALGLDAEVSTSYSNCTVVYGVTVSRNGLAGPGGPFSLTSRGSGEVSRP